MLRLAVHTVAAGPRGAAEEPGCFASAYWFQLREWLRLELADGRAEAALAARRWILLRPAAMHLFLIRFRL